MSEENPTPQEIKEAVSALREEVKKVKPDPEVMEKINKTLDAQEEQNQKMLADIEAFNKREEEWKERLDAMEVELARKGGPGDGKNYKETDEYKALNKFCQYGENIEEKAVLRTDNDTTGGFLVISEMDNTIVKNITEIDQMRTVCRVRTVSGKTLEVPRRKTNVAAQYEGEAEEGPEDNQTYGLETMTPFRQSVTIPITQDMLMDSSFDMESEIMMDAAEAFAYGEGNGFVAGSGHKQPEGIISNTDLQNAARETEAANAISAEDMILLTGDLKVGYNPVYMLNRRVLAILRTLRADAVSAGDASGGFLWQPGLNGPVSNTINGFPYVIMPSMPDINNNAYSVAFGDFRRGYTIIDRTGTSVVRDNLTKKKQAIIEFTIHRWNTGRVILPEAIKLLKVKSAL